jgi:hypothetical protein
MRNEVVVVNDRMQRDYRYVRTEPPGATSPRNSAPS